MKSSGPQIWSERAQIRCWRGQKSGGYVMFRYVFYPPSWRSFSPRGRARVPAARAVDADPNAADARGLAATDISNTRRTPRAARGVAHGRADGRVHDHDEVHRFATSERPCVFLDKNGAVARPVARQHVVIPI